MTHELIPPKPKALLKTYSQIAFARFIRDDIQIAGWIGGSIIQSRRNQSIANCQGAENAFNGCARTQGMSVVSLGSANGNRVRPFTEHFSDAEGFI